MEFLKVLDNIELNEEQIAALDKFFKEHRNKLRKEFMEEFKALNEQNEIPDPNKYIKIEDAERAFELFEQDAERAFELFEQDAERAFELAVEDLKQEYTENMARALHDIYEDIEARVKKDFMESKEYQTIVKLKDLIIPLIEDSDNDLIKKLKAINEEKTKIEEENRQLVRERTINILMRDIPQEYSEIIENFISKGKTEDEIIERFNAILEIIDSAEKTTQANSKAIHKKIQNDIDEYENDKDDKNNEDIDEIQSGKFNKFVRKKKKIDKNADDETNKFNENVEHIFEYETLKKEFEKKENKLMAFTEEEEALLSKINW